MLLQLTLVFSQTRHLRLRFILLLGLEPLTLRLLEGILLLEIILLLEGILLLVVILLLLEGILLLEVILLLEPVLLSIFI